MKNIHGEYCFDNGVKRNCTICGKNFGRSRCSFICSRCLKDNKKMKEVQ